MLQRPGKEAKILFDSTLGGLDKDTIADLNTSHSEPYYVVNSD